MKKTVYFLIVLLLSGIIFMGCEEKLDEDATVDQVAEDMASALGSSNSGISSEIQGATYFIASHDQNAKTAAIDTIYRMETSFTKSNTEGALITFSYHYDVNWGIVFQDYSLNHVYYNSEITGSFDAPRISSTDTRNNKWIITGLQQASTEFILNGESERTGTAQSKIGDQAEIISTSNIVFNDITINKESLEITGGTLDWEIAGTIDDVDFSYDATVVYKGDGMAQININGHKYSIDIEVGEIEK